MIQLSYSTINSCLQPNNSHNWINRQLGLKPEERPEWKAGNIAHNIIQKYISGKEKNKDLAHIEYRFPIVEEKDFDERCKFDFNFKSFMKEAENASGKPLEGKGIKVLDWFQGEYNIIGFYDGLDIKNGRMLEIKSSDPVWSLGRFVSSMQRKLYALSNSKFKEAVLVTCSKDPVKWKNEKPKVYSVSLNGKDRMDAINWIIDAIKLLESGKFDGGLEDGKCTNPYCYYGSNCSFK